MLHSTASLARPAALVLALVLASACADAPGGADPSAADTTTTAASAPPDSPGQARMLAALQQVQEQIADNPFLGHASRDRTRAQLDALPQQPDLRRWLFNLVLGREELRLGNTAQALQHYEEARRQLGTFGAEIPPDKQLQTLYEVGVAWMRHAETENCAQRHTSESCILPIRGGGVHVDQEGSRNAVRAFTEVLRHADLDPWTEVKARWLLNIAYMTLGEYPQGVPAEWRIAPSVFESTEPFPRFEEIAPRRGVNAFDLAGGAIAEDFDGDGWLDLLVSSSDTATGMHFYRADGRGGFRDESRRSGVDRFDGGLNMVQADYDNDGDVDVLVLRGAWWRFRGRHPNSLLRNEGDGRFLDVTFDAGLGEVHHPTQTAAWADYDNDGDLDLYVGNENDPETDAPCQLFRNDGDGRFVDVAGEAGVENRRYTKAVAWGDYDGDRDPDLFVSNMNQRNRLYRNNGDGSFSDVAAEAGVEAPWASFPAWFWDYDNDGRLDLFVASYGAPQMAPDVGAVAASYLGLPHREEPDRLYRNDGRGGFDSVGERAGLRLTTLPMGSNFGDLDNDGYPDFYLGTGYPFYEALMPNVMFRNRGGEAFVDVTTAGGFGHLQKGHGIVFADLDNDGDQDVYEQMGGQYPGDGFGNALFENPGFGAHWLKLDLVGEDSNRSAIGVRIRAEVVERGSRRSIFKWVGSGGSFGGNPLRQEIGLGAAARVETLEIYWPTTDRTQRFQEVEADRLLRIVEGSDAVEELALPPAAELSLLPYAAFGLGVGLASGLTPGPTTALVIAQTLRYGPREGLKVAISPALTDAPIIVAALWVVGRLAVFDTALGIVALAGALFLGYLAYGNLTAPVEQRVDAAERPRSLLKGVLSNLLNPHPYLFWLTVGAPYATRAAQQGLWAAVLFVACHYGAMIGSKMLLALLVHRGRTLLGGGGYRLALRLLGLLLLLFALLFLRDGLRLLGVTAA